MEIIKRVLNWTLVRFVLEVVLFAAFMLGAKWVYTSITGDTSPIQTEEGFASLQRAVFGVGALFLSYSLAVGIVERRWIGELSLKKLGTDGLIGTGYGFLALSSLIGAMFILDGYNVTGVNENFEFGYIFAWVSFFAIMEELLFRGLIYRIAEARFGTWAGLVLSSLYFAYVHINNPHASEIGTIAIILAGLWLGILYTASSGRLWIPIFAHIIWNYAQALYGVPVSGTTAFSNYLEAEISGPEWVTGGQFGPEASYLAVGLIGALFVAGYVFASRHGLIKPLRLSSKEIEVIEEVAEEVIEEAVETAILKS